MFLSEIWIGCKITTLCPYWCSSNRNRFIDIRQVHCL
uniref:Uncharacterized protein n=1 Tax=Arundo donax TaxID=35708 RepID=A0A0A9D474_ARUDO